MINTVTTKREHEVEQHHTTSINTFKTTNSGQNRLMTSNVTQNQQSQRTFRTSKEITYQSKKIRRW